MPTKGDKINSTKEVNKLPYSYNYKVFLYNYSTCYTNRVLTRFGTLSTRLRVRFAYASSILLKH